MNLLEQTLRSEDSAIIQCWYCRQGGRRTEAKLRKSGGTLITPLLATAACFSSQCSTQPNCHHQTPVKWAFNSRQAVLTTFNFQVSIQRTSTEFSLPGSMVPSPASLFILFTSLSINWLVFHHLKLDSYHFARCQRRGGRRGPIFIEKNQRLEEKTILDDILSETYWRTWVSKRSFVASRLFIGIIM